MRSDNNNNIITATTQGRFISFMIDKYLVSPWQRLNDVDKSQRCLQMKIFVKKK